MKKQEFKGLIRKEKHKQPKIMGVSENFKLKQFIKEEIRNILNEDPDVERAEEDAKKAEKNAIEKKLQALQKKKNSLDKNESITELQDDDDWYKPDEEDTDLDKEPSKKDIKKDSISKIALKLKETVKEMKLTLELWKKAEGKEKDKYLNKLKSLTKIKKELEKLL